MVESVSDIQLRNNQAPVKACQVRTYKQLVKNNCTPLYLLEGSHYRRISCCKPLSNFFSLCRNLTSITAMSNFKLKLAHSRDNCKWSSEEMHANSPLVHRLLPFFNIVAVIIHTSCCILSCFKVKTHH